MKNLLLVLFIIFTGTIYNVNYAQHNHSVPKEIKEIFSAKTDTVNGNIIQYRETLICPEASDSAALVIFLHGASGRGHDNLAQLNGTAVMDIYDYLKQHNVHAYFIAPQCPKTASWNGAAPRRDRPNDHNSSPRSPLFGERKEKFGDDTPYVDHLMPFFKQYIAERPISKSKIYILGCSMGAAGTWMLVAENPNFFNAAMMSSGGYRGKDITSLLKTPIVCTIGTQEPSYLRIKQFIDKLQSAGADATIIPINGADHKEACDLSCSKEYLDLFFSKHR